MLVNGPKIDSSAGPEDMRPRDTIELYNMAVDVTSLPGMFNVGNSGGNDQYDEAQRTTEMAATLLSTAIGKKAQIHDSLWKTLKRHAFRQVKSSDDLFKFVNAVSKAESPSYEQQENVISHFMLAPHYDPPDVDYYVQNGFLPRLIYASFRYYSLLLSHICQLAFDHPTKWSKGPAKAMLDYHSDRLLQVRQHALTRKALILHTYVYLRDSDSKGFYHESMTESLWDRFATLSAQKNEGRGGGNGGGGGGDEKGKGKGKGKGDDKGKGGDKANNKQFWCSHCHSSKCHILAGVSPSKTDCPLLDVTDLSKARTIAKEAVELFEEHPTGPFLEVMEGMKNRREGYMGAWIQLV
jgi:hypothetical protein